MPVRAKIAVLAPILVAVASLAIYAAGFISCSYCLPQRSPVWLALYWGVVAVLVFALTGASWLGIVYSAYTSARRGGKDSWQSFAKWLFG